MPTDQRLCPICKAVLEQKSYEDSSQFAKRQTCGASCAGKLTGRKTRQNRLVREATGTKVCRICEQEKSLTEFPKKHKLAKAHGGVYPQSYCFACEDELKRAHRLETYFNITTVEYERIKEYQNSGCAICGFKPAPTQSRLAIDHNHKSGLIRGLLCSFCNRALGRFKDNVEFLKRAAAYLENPTASVVLGAPRYGLPGRVGTKKQRALAKKLRQQKLLAAA